MMLLSVQMKRYLNKHVISNDHCSQVQNSSSWGRAAASRSTLTYWSTVVPGFLFSQPHFDILTFTTLQLVNHFCLIKLFIWFCNFLFDNFHYNFIVIMTIIKHLIINKIC